MKTIQVQTSMDGSTTIESMIRNHKIYVDQPKEAGGQDMGPTPLEYKFLALAGCISSIARIVANQKKIPLRGLKVNVEGALDVEVLMGKAQNGRAGFPKFAVTVDVDADMTQEEKEAFIHEVDRRCPVSDNLANESDIALIVR